jgi:hypothetical protein
MTNYYNNETRTMPALRELPALSIVEGSSAERNYEMLSNEPNLVLNEVEGI